MYLRGKLLKMKLKYLNAAGIGIHEFISLENQDLSLENYFPFPNKIILIVCIIILKSSANEMFSM